MAEVRIGCSGFNYYDWKGIFYPIDLPQSKWLDYYTKIFNTIELNVTFYRLPLLKTFDKWYKETPPDFIFSLKGSRFITHIKRLLDPEDSLRLFFQRATVLKEKLGVVLWQFSPGFTIDLQRLKDFLKLLKPYGIKNAFEFRNESWIISETFNLCRQYNVSLCMADWPEFIDDIAITSDFVYIRRHGKGGSYATLYSKAELKRDANRIRNYLKEGKDVFIYFNNDYHGYAPRNAMELKEMI